MNVFASVRGAGRGQALVEFALVLPVLVLLMVGGYHLGLLYLRVTDVGYIAQSAVLDAARYGGDTAALRGSVDEQVAHSFIGKGNRDFAWHVETRSVSGVTVCGAPGPTGEDGGYGVTCTCRWGERVAVVATYRWELDLLVTRWHGLYQAEKTALCWRGLGPGGE